MEDVMAEHRRESLLGLDNLAIHLQGIHPDIDIGTKDVVPFTLWDAARISLGGRHPVERYRALILESYAGLFCETDRTIGDVLLESGVLPGGAEYEKLVFTLRQPLSPAFPRSRITIDVARGESTHVARTDRAGFFYRKETSLTDILPTSVFISPERRLNKATYDAARDTIA